MRTGFTLRADVITDNTCPNVNVTWTLPNGNRRLGVGESSGRFSVLSNGSLVIRNANLVDRGRYAIEARTTGGADTASSQLNVICKYISGSVVYVVSFFLVSQASRALFEAPDRLQVCPIRIAISSQDNSGEYEPATTSTPTFASIQAAQTSIFDGNWQTESNSLKANRRTAFECSQTERSCSRTRKSPIRANTR